LNDPAPLTDPSEPRAFTSVVAGLQNSYPKEKMEEISTSFCFICLLHLANEKGLRLESAEMAGVVANAEDDGDTLPVEKQVGNLWDLRVRWFGR
jgi:condensin complex subunit 2